jgi:hypothetical protein
MKLFIMEFSSPSLHFIRSSLNQRNQVLHPNKSPGAVLSRRREDKRPQTERLPAVGFALPLNARSDTRCDVSTALTLAVTYPLLRHSLWRIHCSDTRCDVSTAQTLAVTCPVLRHSLWRVHCSDTRCDVSTAQTLAVTCPLLGAAAAVSYINYNLWDYKSAYHRLVSDSVKNPRNEQSFRNRIKKKFECK